MKKFFFLSLLSIGMMAQAQVYYLLPNSDDQNSEQVTNVYDNTREENMLQWDQYLEVADQSPERRAYEWFKEVYNGGEQKVVTIKDLRDGRLEMGNENYLADVKVIWVNIDRMRSNEADGKTYGMGDMADLGFDTDAVNALASFVQNGGSLLLTTYATPLVYQMGRYQHNVTTFENNRGFYTEADEAVITWGVNAVLGKGLEAHLQMDRRGHALYADLKTATLDGTEAFPLMEANLHTNANCFWNDYVDMSGEKIAENNTIDGIVSWEAMYNAEVLGTWTHIGDYCLPAIVEFKSDDTNWKGTVLTIGIAAYSWGRQNIEGETDAKFNMHKMTENALNYLIPESTTTAADVVEMLNVNKVMNNGQLMIIKNGQRFNACGQEIR